MQRPTSQSLSRLQQLGGLLWTSIATGSAHCVSDQAVIVLNMGIHGTQYALTNYRNWAQKPPYQFVVGKILLLALKQTKLALKLVESLRALRNPFNEGRVIAFHRAANLLLVVIDFRKFWKVAYRLVKPHFRK